MLKTANHDVSVADKSSSRTYGFVSALKLIQIASYDDTLHPAARRMLGVIAAHTDKGGFCYPSIKQIAKKMMITRQAVIQQIRSLEEHGYLKSWPQKRRDGATMPNLYELNFKMAQDFEDETHIFCKRNIACLIMYHVMLGTYPPCNAQNLQEVVSSENYPKRPVLKDTKIKKPSSKTAQIKRNHVSQKKNEWHLQKEVEKIKGVSAKEEKEVSNLFSDLCLLIGARNALNLDHEWNNQIQDAEMTHKEAYDFKKENLQKELKMPSK